MKKVFLGLSLVALSALSSCDIEEFFDKKVDAYDMHYVEKLVVQGELHAGKPVDSIIISRTLPADQKYSLRKARLDNVQAYISDGTSVYPLVLQDTGRYTVPNFIPQSGTVYTLHAEWEGKKIKASTLVPRPVMIDTVIITHIIDTIRYRYGGEYIRDFYQGDVIFSPIGSQAYLAFGEFIRTNYNYRQRNQFGDYDNIKRADNISGDGKIHFRGDVYYAQSTYYPGDTLNIVIETYDEPYYEFYKTFHSYGGDNPLSNGGENIHWNVTGDGIGLFIGRATSRKMVPFVK